MSLADQVNTPEAWPTPKALDSEKGPSEGELQRNSPTLAAVVHFHTPRANDAEKRGQLGNDPRHGLPAQVQHLPLERFPTPAASDGSRAGTITPGMTGQSLPQAIKSRHDSQPQSVPTPSANDYKGSSKPGQRRGQLTDPAMGVIEPGGQLNPDWVEWLMGWPIGWTNIAEPLPTTEPEPWSHEPAHIPRTVRNQPARAARLRCIGNGQVPLCMAVAFEVLSQ